MSEEQGGAVYRFTRPKFNDYHLTKRDDGVWIQHNGGSGGVNTLDPGQASAWFDEEYSEGWEQETVSFEKSPFTEDDLE